MTDTADKVPPSETTDHDTSSSGVASASRRKEEDVTKLCREAASMLGPNEMIHDPDFSLYGAMSALELMDAKMDKAPPALEVRYQKCLVQRSAPHIPSLSCWSGAHSLYLLWVYQYERHKCCWNIILRLNELVPAVSTSFTFPQNTPHLPSPISCRCHGGWIPTSLLYE